MSKTYFTSSDILKLIKILTCTKPFGMNKQLLEWWKLLSNIKPLKLIFGLCFEEGKTHIEWKKQM